MSCCAQEVRSRLPAHVDVVTVFMEFKKGGWCVGCATPAFHRPRPAKVKHLLHKEGDWPFIDPPVLGSATGTNTCKGAVQQAPLQARLEKEWEVAKRRNHLVSLPTIPFIPTPSHAQPTSNTPPCSTRSTVQCSADKAMNEQRRL